MAYTRHPHAKLLWMALWLPVVTPHITAQMISTSRIDNASPLPLVISNRSSNGLPLSIITGASQTRALEIGPSGNTWLRGPVSIGVGIGTAPRELMRIGSIAGLGGKGLTISLDATTMSTGLLVQDIGATGTNDAGIVLSSQSNGLGTGMRLGGPIGSGRPSLGTGIDITGGTGIRYNALTAGSGAAIDIGGTTPPRRGIEVVASGSQHVGVVARANTGGMGILGVSQSSTYEALPVAERIGVRGHAATNSGIAADSITGVLGSVQRGGNGGTQTFSVGVFGRGENTATANAGTTLGIYGTAAAASAGVTVAIGGGFVTDTGQIALLCVGGDVILGGVRPLLPVPFQTSTFRDMITRNRTYAHHFMSSGMTRLTGLALSPTPKTLLPPGGATLLTIAGGTVVKLVGDVNGSVISGIRADASDRVLTLLVTQGRVELAHEHPAADATDRIRIKNEQTLTLETDDMIELWYDQEIERWRCYSF